MGKRDRSVLEERLARHYACRREAASPETLGRLALAMAAEDAIACGTKADHVGAIDFVASQVRYIPAWSWAAQATLVVLMCALAHAVGGAGSTKVAVGILSAMCALAGAPCVQASRLNGMAELEYACLHDTADVLVVRMIVLGCSSALAVALMVAATAPAVDASALEVALWACTPFFLSSAGSLLALRRTNPATAPAFCVVWAAACSVALPALASVLPDLYVGTSLMAWASAAAAALLWLVREVALTLRSAYAGLDVLSPQLASAYC